MKSFMFEIPGEPYAKQRHRTNFKTHREYNPPKNEQFENLVRLSFREKYPDEKPTDEWIVMNIIAIYPIPKSWTKSDKIKADENRIFPKKHDWDNIGKIVCDGLNGVAYHDDKQIFDAMVYKRFGDRPRTVVMMNVFDDEDLKGGIAELIWHG